MSGLILVSHNLSRSSTLAVIYDSVLRHHAGSALWVSWNGQTEDAITPRRFSYQQGADYDRLTFPLTQAGMEGGYQNYIHKGLWAVFHQRPDLARFSQSDWLAYRQLNEAYAAAISEHATPDDLIWIQDYHLIPCVKLLREAGLTNRIGLFFHQPFPSGQMFEAIPDWRWLAESLLCADMLGFQTQQDRRHFLLWLESRFRIERQGMNCFRIHDRIVISGVFPSGIDPEDAHYLSESNSCRAMEEQCRNRLPQNTILSGGHLDDSAGLPWRISAVEVLLRRYEEYNQNISLLQLASPASGYAHRSPAISHELETQCGELNGVHGTLDWYPVSCLTQRYSREEQAGIYRSARVALVTPLVAGMSLMAKMYVALQNPENPGVLILSQFAGASEHMSGAIIVNPYDPDAIADAIHSALHLPLRERQKRHARLMKGIHEQDCHWWANQFLTQLLNPKPESTLPLAGSIALSSMGGGRIRY